MDNSGILNELRDIDGVVGSFVLSALGEPRLRDLPQVVHDSALGAAGSKVKRLLEAFSELGAVDGCTLRFSEHRLNVRPAGAWLLCVLSTDAANQPTVNMGMTLVARRLAAMKLDAQPAATPTAHTVPTLKSQVVAPPEPKAADTQSAESARRNMMYRGRPVP